MVSIRLLLDSSLPAAVRKGFVCGADFAACGCKVRTAQMNVTVSLAAFP